MPALRLDREAGGLVHGEDVDVFVEDRKLDVGCDRLAGARSQSRVAMTTWFVRSRWPGFVSWPSRSTRPAAISWRTKPFESPEYCRHRYSSSSSPARSPDTTNVSMELIAPRTSAPRRRRGRSLPGRSVELPQDADVRQIAIAPVEVEAVAHHEQIVHLEHLEVGVEFDGPAARLVEEHARRDLARSAREELRLEAGHGLAGVEDVVDQEEAAPLDLPGREEADLQFSRGGLVPVGGGGDERQLEGDGDPADEIG